MTNAEKVKVIKSVEYAYREGFDDAFYKLGSSMRDLAWRCSESYRDYLEIQDSITAEPDK